MSEVRDNQEGARAARIALSKAEEDLYIHRNHLRYKQKLLANGLRQGGAGSRAVVVLQREIRTLEAQIDEAIKSLGTAKANLVRILEEFTLLDRPWELVEQLNDNIPFLLFPVRIETRFMSENNLKELWVRIFPDDIAAHTHEKTLTTDEVDAVRNYWREIWAATRETIKAQREKIEKGAWRALAEAYGGTRAAWIVSETKPVTLEVGNADDLELTTSGPETLKDESWSRAPRSNIMPDRFVVMGYSGDAEIFRLLGNLIPNPLIMGPNPQQPEEEFRQQDGELLVGQDIEWIYEFDKAVEVGMGLKIPLQEPFASEGFDRLLVLGLRLSSDESENQKQLEELLDNHHYSPDGLSVLAQGTPTNNTDSKGSGFSGRDSGAESSYIIETGKALFEPTDEPLEKTDGQRLAEALGIDHEPLLCIQGSGQRDVAEAMIMNKALSHGTLDYYLEVLLGLDLTTVGLAREFFTDYVTGRGPLPAIRVGTQPYGVLLTSDFSQWKWSRAADGDRVPFLDKLHDLAAKAEVTWRRLAARAPHVGVSGDPHENLLSMLGQHATSVEFHRRHALGKGHIWNYTAFQPGIFLGQQTMAELEKQRRALLDDLGFDPENLPKIFDLTFFGGQDAIDDPLVDDIPADEAEKWSEIKALKRLYSIPDLAVEDTNYIGWLAHSSFDDLKFQRFLDRDGINQPVPRPLLYRMLRAALLQAKCDSTMQLYTTFDLLPLEARREVELSNIDAERTVTRWEFMNANVSQVLPQLSQESMSVGRFLQTDEGLSRPEALSLREVRECLTSLVEIKTARLERIFVEHLDLCSYRLDAWQMGCFNRRLQQQRLPAAGEGAFDSRVQGIYLGAFGWLEHLRPAPELKSVSASSVLGSLHDFARDGPLFAQPDNGGFIHGPSLNHAVSAAVLRNAFVTHFDPERPEQMATNLSSERVRTALFFLEGIRNGQELGALLGYQFERGLHDDHGTLGLGQYVPNMRSKYPLLADKITEDEDGEPIETKEARNVLDGYALLEAAFLKEETLEYPYDIVGLPLRESEEGKAILAEVSRLASSLDAIGDLALAEGVYQATQGNFDRAGAMLKALTGGHNPIEPEIVRTPRSGVALTQRVALHLDTGNGDASVWPDSRSRRAAVEPNLNKWLANLLPAPDQIHYAVRLGDAAPASQDLSGLGLEPIDLVYLIGDDLTDETTELESRIAYENRREEGNDSLEVRIEFMTNLSGAGGATLFELLPLLRALRALVTGSRPLTADDFGLPSEAAINLEVDPNPQRIDLDELNNRVAVGLALFNDAANALGGAIPNADSDGNRDLNLVVADDLRDTLGALADFGFADAIPLSAVGESVEVKVILLNQALRFQEIVGHKAFAAANLIVTANDPDLKAQERAGSLSAAAQTIFGPAFNLIPVFNLQNPAEMQAAANFRDANSGLGLTRHHQDNPYIVDEWLQGAARVREKLGPMESIEILAPAMGTFSLELKPLQLPFRKTDYWVAVEYPEVQVQDLENPDVFLPEGDFLSLIQWLPNSGFDPAEAQSGLLVDEWLEFIPGRRETTGIAVHYNQPSTEPPQVLLLAVTPDVSGAWTWDKLTGILNDTLERTKQRAVEPDQLGETAFGQLLPAVISAVTSYPPATISTDFVHETTVIGAHGAPDEG